MKYLKDPCGRCGNKRRISKTWKDTIPTLTGTAEIEYSQIICTNKACQAAFDKNLVEETKKQLVIKQKKEASDAIRKANALTRAKFAKKSSSRI